MCVVFLIRKRSRFICLDKNTLVSGRTYGHEKSFTANIEFIVAKAQFEVPVPKAWFISTTNIMTMQRNNSTVLVLATQ